LHWNKDGKAVLVVTHTDEDAYVLVVVII